MYFESANTPPAFFKLAIYIKDMTSVAPTKREEHHHTRKHNESMQYTLHTLTATLIRPESSLESCGPPSMCSLSILLLLLVLADPEVLRSPESASPLRRICDSLAKEPFGLLLLPGGGGYARGEDTTDTPRLLIAPVRFEEELGEVWPLPLPWAPPHRGDAGFVLPSAVLPNVEGIGLGMTVLHAVKGWVREKANLSLRFESPVRMPTASSDVRAPCVCTLHQPCTLRRKNPIHVSFRRGGNEISVQRYCGLDPCGYKDTARGGLGKNK